MLVRFMSSLSYQKEVRTRRATPTDRRERLGSATFFRQHRRSHART